MLTSAMIMSCGALAVALINDRVPVFEIVVRHLFSCLLHLFSVLQACSCLHLMARTKWQERKNSNICGAQGNHTRRGLSPLPISKH